MLGILRIYCTISHPLGTHHLIGGDKQINKLSAVLTGAVPTVWTGSQGTLAEGWTGGPHVGLYPSFERVFPKQNIGILCLKNIMGLLFH